MRFCIWLTLVFIFSRAATATPAAFFGIVRRCAVCAELTDREWHISEDLTGIILLYRSALLFGDAVFRCIDQILRRANDANDRKDAEGNGKIASLPDFSIVEDQGSIHACENGIRQIVLAAATAAFAFAELFKDPTSENDGIYSLYDCGGNVFLSANGIGITTKSPGKSVALEDINVAFATVKDHALLDCGNSLNLLRVVAANADLEQDLYVEADSDRIKSAVELDGINSDTAPNDMRVLGANRGRALDDLVSKIRKIYPHVLIAITVATGIQHAVGFNADRITTNTGWRRTGESVFRHKRLSPF